MSTKKKTVAGKAAAKRPAPAGKKPQPRAAAKPRAAKAAPPAPRDEEPDLNRNTFARPARRADGTLTRQTTLVLPLTLDRQINDLWAENRAQYRRRNELTVYLLELGYAAVLKANRDEPSEG